MDAPALEVRRRLPWAVFGLVAFAVLGRLSEAGFFSSVAFGIGVGTFASATFVEPFFTRPQDALVNCLAGVVAFAAVTKPPERGLWVAWLVLVLCVLAGAVAAILIRGSGRTPVGRSGLCESFDEPVEWVQGARTCRDAGTRRSRSSGS
jgi:hypothetical protein